MSSSSISSRQPPSPPSTAALLPVAPTAALLPNGGPNGRAPRGKSPLPQRRRSSRQPPSPLPNGGPPPGNPPLPQRRRASRQPSSPPTAALLPATPLLPASAPTSANGAPPGNPPPPGVPPGNPTLPQRRPQRRRKEVRIKELELEIEELRRTLSEQSSGESRRLSSRTGEIDECSSSQRFQGLIDASSRSNLLRNLRNGPKPTEIASNQEVQKPETTDLKAEEWEAERTQQSGCDREDISKPRAPWVPRPPPLPSSISSSSSCTASSSESSSSSEMATSITISRAPNLAGLPPIPPPAPGAGARPPPPPPPPPLAKGSRSAAASVRRVPEVVEFYHSLMRRDSKRESGSGLPDAPATANARNMIGEIENRSAHLLAVSPSSSPFPPLSAIPSSTYSPLFWRWWRHCHRKSSQTLLLKVT